MSLHGSRAHFERRDRSHGRRTTPQGIGAAAAVAAQTSMKSGTIAAALVAAALLAGCNYLESAEQAEAVCDVEAMKAGYHPGLEGGDALAEHFKRRCMIARGWKQRLDSGGRPAGPYVRFFPWE